MKKLKIAMLTTTFFPQVGGAEYQVKWLAEELAKKGHEVYLFTPYGAEEFIDVDDRGFPKNIALRERGANIFSDGSRMLYRFTKWVRRIKPDIVHANFAFSSGFLAVITKPVHKAPVVITSYGEDIDLDREIGYGLRTSRIKSALIRFTLKNCDKQVLVSNSMRQSAKEAGSTEEKIQIIYCMFRPSNIEITEKDIESVKRKYDIPLDTNIILAVSRLDYIKGLNYLIEAMGKISEKRPDVLLVIAGKGEERQKLEKLVEDMNLKSKVRFTGFVNECEKIALINGCDIFCLPSLKECLPISLFEPMYYSKAIVATNVGGVAEAIGGGECLVEQSNANSLSVAILKLLSDNNRRREIGEMVNKQLNFFLPENVITEYEQLIHETLSNLQEKG